MLNKIKESFKNLKVGLLYFLIRIQIKKENRQLFLKWIEMKEDIINEYEFNVWVTRNILDEGPEDEMEEVDL